MALFPDAFKKQNLSDPLPMSNALSCQSRGYLKAQKGHKKNDCSSLRDTKKKRDSYHIRQFAELWFRDSVSLEHWSTDNTRNSMEFSQNFAGAIHLM